MMHHWEQLNPISERHCLVPYCTFSITITLIDNDEILWAHGSNLLSHLVSRKIPWNIVATLYAASETPVIIALDHKNVFFIEIDQSWKCFYAALKSGLSSACFSSSTKCV